MRRLPALVPWSATSRSRAAPCCSGSSSQSSSLWPSWRAVEGDVAGASGGWVVAGAGVGAGAGAEVVVAASAGSGAGVVSQAAVREGASNMASKLTVEQFAAEVARALGARLVALLLYGSWARGTHVPDRSDVNTLLICDTVDDALFATLAPAMRAWTRAGHPAPLILTEREWRESADAFPIEYEDMRDAHRLLAGRDPWPGIQVDRGQLRRQLEHELMGKLVRLRQAYAALHEDPKQLARVVVGSAGGFFTMLRAVLRRAGRPVPASPADLVRSAAALAGFPADALAPLVQHAMGGPVPRLGKGDPLAAAYLEAVARTAEYVNRLT